MSGLVCVPNSVAQITVDVPVFRFLLTTMMSALMSMLVHAVCRLTVDRLAQQTAIEQPTYPFYRWISLRKEEMMLGNG